MVSIVCHPKADDFILAWINNNNKKKNAIRGTSEIILYGRADLGTVGLEYMGILEKRKKLRLCPVLCYNLNSYL